VAPAFLITIDTEGDDLWSSPSTITTKNADYLPRFQQLCEKYKFKPTWLTNYEMAISERFVELGRDAVARDAAEIGMHLHAWNSPPVAPLTDDDYRHCPYLIEYPPNLIEDKIRFMTRLLEERFARPVTSHRAGRWAFNEVYARALLDLGYVVDTSVTPHVSWREYFGDPKGNGGPDFSAAPELPYFLSEHDVRVPGSTRLLEVPMTILTGGPAAESIRTMLPTGSVFAKAWRRASPPARWLRPKGTNLKPMLSILDRVLKEKRPCAVFMLHSSEMMPGGSPNFPTPESIEVLYEHMEAVFQTAATKFQGQTLTEFARAFA
jgi:hypothetical protein